MLNINDDEINKFGIENLINSILVDENVRPAFLLQPADYNEASGKDKETKAVLLQIKKHFPHFKLNENYTPYQGIIISKRNYNNIHEISGVKMGEILGYPCNKDFDSIDPNIISHVFEIKKNKAKFDEFKE